ncbi:Protein OS-9 like [Dissostichus eleginoides]|uniref:Protein OS-9 like n=1 Tax=Dissostichus eleginoides TaxID=100907 RepID=A0AAD9C866_DISEL|nr:Protein OS-9 like [Dissostichus eleginoides]
MGKIESGEIGEVDPLPDSGNSLALIRYARRAVSSHSPQHAERGGSLRGGQRKPICSSVGPAPSSGHPQERQNRTAVPGFSQQRHSEDQTELSMLRREG